MNESKKAQVIKPEEVKLRRKIVALKESMKI